MILYCATTNPGKLREFRNGAEELAPGRIQVEPLPHWKDIPPPAEHGATFEENAIAKALYYSLYEDAPVFAEDSGLEVEALDGAPGVRSARFAGEGASDEENNDLLLERLENVENRKARYRSVIALVEKGNLLGTFSGSVEGEILRERRGTNGFGYDPLFFHPPSGCTFAEAPLERKLAVSHRGEAFRELLGFLKTRI